MPGEFSQLGLFWLRIVIFERVARSGLRSQWRTRQILVAVGRRQQHAGHDHRRLTQVVCLQMVQSVDVRMVYPRFVIQGVLDELEARDRDRLERLVISTRGWTGDDRS